MSLLLIIVVVALFASFIALQIVAMRRWQGAWRAAALLPVIAVSAVILNIIIGVQLDPTSHNLWPMELLLLIGGGIVFLLALMGLRKITKRSQ